ARILRAQPTGGASFTVTKINAEACSRSARSAYNAHGLKALRIRRAADAPRRLPPPRIRAAPGKRYDMTHGTAADFARRHVEEIINGRRLDLVDELYAPDAVYNDPVAPGGTARGRDEIKA